MIAFCFAQLIGSVFHLNQLTLIRMQIWNTELEVVDFRRQKEYNCKYRKSIRDHGLGYINQIMDETR